jgi:hypothetical protein
LWKRGKSGTRAADSGLQEELRLFGASAQEGFYRETFRKTDGRGADSSLPVALISIIAFYLTEDISLPTAFVDNYTVLMAIIAIAQTVVVALSRKKEEHVEEEEVAAEAHA